MSDDEAPVPFDDDGTHGDDVELAVVIPLARARLRRVGTPVVPGGDAA